MAYNVHIHIHTLKTSTEKYKQTKAVSDSILWEYGGWVLNLKTGPYTAATINDCHM